MGGAWNLLGWCLKCVGWLGVLALGFMVASITYDVIMRYVFSRPTHWALEVNTFILVFLSVVPAGDVLRAKGHIRVGFFVERLPQKAVRLARGLRAGLGVVLCGVMTWKGWTMAWQAFQHNDRMSTSLGTPMVIPYLFLPVGFGLMGLYFLGALWKES